MKFEGRYIISVYRPDASAPARFDTFSARTPAEVRLGVEDLIRDGVDPKHIAVYEKLDLKVIVTATVEGLPVE